jgi:hypothetical protein
MNTKSWDNPALPQGRLTWLPSLLFLPARSGLLIFGQTVFALWYRLHGRQSPWFAAGAWWTVWGSVSDLGCLAILFVLTRFCTRSAPRSGRLPERLFGYGSCLGCRLLATCLARSANGSHACHARGLISQIDCFLDGHFWRPANCVEILLLLSELSFGV